MKDITKIAAFLLIGVVFSFGAHAQVTSGETFGMSQYGAWQSLGVAGKDQSRYRAITAGDSQGVFLIYDLDAATCRAYIQFSFLYDVPLNADVDLRHIPVNIRVDSSELYVLDAVYSAVMGDKQGFITLLATDKYSDLLANMKAGNVMRVKFQYANGQPIATVAFSLSGFTRSLNRIENACVSTLNAKRPIIPPSVKPSTPNTTKPPAPTGSIKYL